MFSYKSYLAILLLMPHLSMVSSQPERAEISTIIGQEQTSFQDFYTALSGQEKVNFMIGSLDYALQSMFKQHHQDHNAQDFVYNIDNALQQLVWILHDLNPSLHPLATYGMFIDYSFHIFKHGQTSQFLATLKNSDRELLISRFYDGWEQCLGKHLDDVATEFMTTSNEHFSKNITTQNKHEIK